MPCALRMPPQLQPRKAQRAHHTLFSAGYKRSEFLLMERGRASKVTLMRLGLPFRFSGLTAAVLFSGYAALAAETPSKPMAEGVQITKLPDRLRVEINGSLFTEYFFKDVPRPYCYPLIGPGNLPMTRNWPMQSPSGEEHDHPHHRSFWFAHGDINGIDFWTERAGCGKTVHKEFKNVQSGKDAGVIESHNDWVGPDGKVV